MQMFINLGLLKVLPGRYKNPDFTLLATLVLDSVGAGRKHKIPGSAMRGSVFLQEVPVL